MAFQRKIIFEENGGEYYGSLLFTGDELVQIDKRTLRINGTIKIDEDIVEINEVKPEWLLLGLNVLKNTNL